jgi:transcriptional regulator with XRE-family HTH domain
VKKAIHSPEQAALARLLRDARKDAGLSQVEMAAALDKPQSFISNMERGRRRLDLVELRQVCQVLGVALSGFVAKWEKALSG